MREKFTSSREEMLAFGQKLSHEITDGDVVCFSGDLGAGKTTLIKGIISGLTGCDVDDVTSPTFTYLIEYGRVVHFDLYRLNGIEQFAQMGFEEYFNPRHICLIEWPERIAGNLPEHETISISHEDGGRKITTTLRRKV